jgi:hypothetical protein
MSESPLLTVPVRNISPSSKSVEECPREVSRQRVACFFPFASHSWTQFGGLCGVPAGHMEGKEQAYAAALLS